MAHSEGNELVDAFREFFQSEYQDELLELAQHYPDEQRSLHIEWTDLDRYNSDLADDLLTHPDQIIRYAEEALRQLELPVDVKFGQARVRVQGLRNPTRIGDIRSKHNETLVSLPGTVRSTSSIVSFPQEAAFECQRCGTLTRIPQSVSTDNQSINEPHECMGCEQSGPFQINQEQSEYVDLRRLRIESNLADQTTESPESIVAIVTDDIVDAAEPGDTVCVNGVVKLIEFGKNRSQLDATVNDKYISTSSIEEFNSGDLLDVSDADKERMYDESKHPDLYQRIVDSIAPHVPDCEEEKLAVALQLFGGVKKELPDGTVIPGDIHIGLVSDPGLFASEIVEYAARIAPKSVQVNGTDTTQVGLTSAAYKSSAGTKNWELDAGALVLADDGIACITQADELPGDAHAALHSVMRDQEVKASKGTATQTLPAETTVLASLNPKYGRFDQYEPIGEQIGLEPALVSRFDLLFTLTDRPDSDADAESAEHILRTNYAGELKAQQERAVATTSEADCEEVLEEVAPPISPTLLRKYIAYAQQNCFPTMSEEAKEAIEDFYVSMREKGQDEDVPVPVTARKLEALVRLAEASARIRLSDEVAEEDAQRVIDLVQSCLQDIGVNPETGQFDTSVVETGNEESEIINLDEDSGMDEAVRAIISDVEEGYGDGAPVEVVKTRTKEKLGLDVNKVEHNIDKLKQKGEVYEPKRDHLRTT